MPFQPHILFLSARRFGSHPGVVDDVFKNCLPGVADNVYKQIMARIDAFDQVLPGFRRVVDGSNLIVVYDPKNYHGIFEQQASHGAYFWPLHTMYLGKSGIERSIIHEGAHILDILAGPTIAECQAKFGRAESIPYSVYHFWPDGGKFRIEKDRFEDCFERSFIAQLIGGALIARRNENARKAALGRLLIASVEDVEQNEFIADRISNLAEEWVFTWQTDRQVPLCGVGDKEYFSTPTFWGSEWIREHEEPITRFFKGMVDTIDNRLSNGTLNTKLEELRRSF